MAMSKVEYQKKRSAGICGRSGCTTTAIEGSCYCEQCRYKEKLRKEKLKDYRDNHSLCRKCNKDVVQGRTNCADCIERTRIRVAGEKHKHSLKQCLETKAKNNICITCSNDQFPGLRYCETCIYKIKAKYHLGDRKLWHLIRNLMEKQSHRCAISGVPIDLSNCDVDHIIPKAKGGMNIIDNLQVVNRVVNRMKGDLSMEELLTWMRAITNYHDN